MSQTYFHTLNTTEGPRFVANPIIPVSSSHSVPGFFNIAHRGASFYAPENTFPAFQKAVEMNADMIELDVTLTRENIPVVFHDRKLHRTTNGKGEIGNYFERELKELDAGLWFDPEYSEIRIPSLEDVLKWASGTIALNIEIKKEAVMPERKNGITELIYELVTEYEMSEQVVISSFSEEALKRFRVLSPAVATAYLINPYALGTPKVYDLMKKMNACGLNMTPRQMRNRLMRVVKKNCVPVWVYTVDDELEMNRTIKKGATGIFTNRPDVLGQVSSAVFGD